MIPVPSVRDVEIFEAMTPEQRRAAGLLAIRAAREACSATISQERASAWFWADDPFGFPNLLRDAGFPV